MKIALHILFLVLFVSNYQICNALYNYNTNPDDWWRIRIGIFSCLIAWGIVQHDKQVVRVSERLALAPIKAVLYADIIDRFILKNTLFNYMDIIIILLSLVFDCNKIHKTYVQNGTNNR